MRGEMREKLDALGWQQIHPDHSAPSGYLGRVESVVGRSLPPDYRAFLTRYPCDSGPRTSTQSPIIKGPCEGGDPSLLVCFGHNPDSVDLIAINQDTDWAIDGMMVIGDDIFGNWFYLDLARGSVWFLDRDASVPILQDGLALVGNGFDDFIMRMEPSSDDDSHPESLPRSLFERLLDWFR